MITLLYLGLTLALCAVVHLVRMGARAIVELCAALERDRRVEYSHPVPSVPARQCPPWLRRAGA